MTSPFYPGTNYQFAWNSSALSVLKDCPRKYQYKYLEGWTPKGEGIHIRFGSLFHKGLELYDHYTVVDKDDHETALDRVVDYLLQATWDGRDENGEGGAPWDTSEHRAGSKKNRDTLLRSVIWYIDHYKDDPTPTIILGSGKPAVEIPFRFASEKLTPHGDPYIFTGHMDRLVMYGEDKFVMDRKTTGAGLAYNYAERFNPDNQMSLYTYAARIVYDVPVSGVLIDAASILVGYTTFGRFVTTRDDYQLTEWMNDTLYWLQQAERYVEEDYWPMNDQSCHKYDGCEYRHICKLTPVIRKSFLQTDFEFNTHNADRILEDN